MRDEFNKRYAEIKKSIKDIYVISDATGTKVEVHYDLNKKVISTGGLESIKNYAQSLLEKQKQDIITLIENENTDFPVRESDEFDEGGRMFKQALLGKLRSK